SARSVRISSRPGSLGRPRSMMARSTGYSRPAYRPSSPSDATSTVKPAATSSRLSDSRRISSSSTTRMRIGCLTLRAARCVDLHGPDATVLRQQAQDMHDAPVLGATGFGADHARLVLALGLPDCGIERHAGGGRLLLAGPVTAL